jgi:hypothetical protein
LDAVGNRTLASNWQMPDVSREAGFAPPPITQQEVFLIAQDTDRKHIQNNQIGFTRKTVCGRSAQEKSIRRRRQRD